MSSLRFYEKVTDICFQKCCLYISKLVFKKNLPQRKPHPTFRCGKQYQREASKLTLLPLFPTCPF